MPPCRYGSNLTWPATARSAARHDVETGVRAVTPSGWSDVQGTAGPPALAARCFFDAGAAAGGEAGEQDQRNDDPRTHAPHDRRERPACEIGGGVYPPRDAPRRPARCCSCSPSPPAAGESAVRTVTVTAPATTAAPPTTAQAATTAPAVPTLHAQGAADRAACNELQTNIRIVSQLVATASKRDRAFPASEAARQAHGGHPAEPALRRERPLIDRSAGLARARTEAARRSACGSSPPTSAAPSAPSRRQRLRDGRPAARRPPRARQGDDRDADDRPRLRRLSTPRPAGR